MAGKQIINVARESGEPGEGRCSVGTKMDDADDPGLIVVSKRMGYNDIASGNTPVACERDLNLLPVIFLPVIINALRS